ncbi:hypothetical protein J6590_069418 [Homalodisca vitripennis]|nr:hypothetical protein J6590_069418 [Homalodisca vitripennis]
MDRPAVSCRRITWLALPAYPNIPALLSPAPASRIGLISPRHLALQGYLLASRIHVLPGYDPDSGSTSTDGNPDSSPCGGSSRGCRNPGESGTHDRALALGQASGRGSFTHETYGGHISWSEARDSVVSSEYSIQCTFLLS